MPTQSTLPAIATHGAIHLPSVDVDSYNIELKDDEGFIGDRASKGSFRAILENWRKPLRKLGQDPFGEEPSTEISKKTLDAVLTEGNPEAAGVLHGAIEDFAQELAIILRRYIKTKAWKDTERVAVGGGFIASRVGELAIGRASVILKADGINTDLVPIHNDPDEAGLIGSAHLCPAWVFHGYDGILAVDIGGTNIRAGVVQLNLRKNSDLSKACVEQFELWRHGDEENLKREEAIEGLTSMLQKLLKAAKKDGLKLAPFIGIGCPGKILEDGAIEKGAQNLPGNWESSKFNLPARVHEAIPGIGDHPTAIVMHNDAVVQGLSEVPFMQDVKRWGALTIGTGLGNARFTNHEKKS